MKKKNKTVFYVSLFVVIIVVLWALIFPTNFETKTNSTLNFLVEKFGWFYLTTINLFIFFCIWIASSKYGNIKLGPDDSKPKYSYISWFAMLFSAGMGIGLVFWGVAEPLNHFINPIGVEGGTEAAKSFAMTKSFMHWGLHPWANYSVLALSLAYMQFRMGKPSLISSIFIPLIGEERVKGKIGKSIDVLAIFATVTGVATSLGLGTLQINSGLNYLFNIPENTLTQLLIVVAVTAIFMLSTAKGLDKGMKVLSNTNVIIAGTLLVFCFIIGPTLNIFSNLGNGLLAYTKDLFVELNPFGKNEWYKDWTIFYWAWWISWAPFVGTFIARISRGRTIREFVIGVLLVPSLISFLWFSAFGTLGIDTGMDVAKEAIIKAETAFFVIMKYQSFGSLISMAAIVLLGTFFITSADSATFVLGMMSSNGDLNPSTRRKLTWGVIQSALALSLMVAGGLEMLQTASIIVAFPFAIVMVFAMVSMTKALKNERFSKEQ
ncbi:BCCT family transporter [Maledivibacter halophilus]|uniref:Glycine betaine transporter n=1 Tax=Maledivibacter halophilus TaxID=36842 RepID=A0A1T5L449_9FIRM|nr:BCCT family transporter [Maledivibacter halophilus]SKC70822.1 glycine betaine transporter [Maledivibacter halophilus]